MQKTPLNTKRYDISDVQDCEMVFKLLSITNRHAATAIDDKLYVWDIHDGKLEDQKCLKHDEKITAVCLMENKDLFLGDEKGIFGLWETTETGWKHVQDFFTKHQPILEIYHIPNLDLVITEVDSLFSIIKYPSDGEDAYKQEIEMCSILKFNDFNERRKRAIGYQSNTIKIYEWIDKEFTQVGQDNLPKVQQIAWMTENKFATAELIMISENLLTVDNKIQRLQTWGYTGHYMIYNRREMLLLLQNSIGFEILEFDGKEISIIQSNWGDYVKCKMSSLGEYIISQNKETKRIELWKKEK